MIEKKTQGESEKMDFSKIRNKVLRRLNKIRFSPIEVFVFHAVSKQFDERQNLMVDWISVEKFKEVVLRYQKEFQFISLEEANKKLHRNWWRSKRFAVLTCDDGYQSILSILPFLEENRIPITLFVNPKYLDGVSKREDYADEPKYISKEELWALKSEYVTIGMHGFEHLDATKQSEEEFNDSIERSIESIGSHERFILYFAYTWGNYNRMTQRVLAEKKIVPVLTDGLPNFQYGRGISRKSLEEIIRKEKS